MARYSCEPRYQKTTARLANGSQLTKISSAMVDGKKHGEYEGFMFQFVSYGDFMGDGNEEAIIVLIYLTGGTQTTHYVYIYAPGSMVQDSLPIAIPEAEQTQDSTVYTRETACSSLSYWIQRERVLGHVVLPASDFQLQVAKQSFQAGGSHRTANPSTARGTS